MASVYLVEKGLCVPGLFPFALDRASLFGVVEVLGDPAVGSDPVGLHERVEVAR
jgi:hypothetical protein